MFCFTYLYSNLTIFISDRLPKEGELRMKWIEAVTENQNFDHHCSYFMICEKHFENQDFNPNCKKKILKKGAVPTIFIGTSSDECTMIRDSEASTPTQQCCNECAQLNVDILKLNDQIQGFERKQQLLNTIIKRLRQNNSKLTEENDKLKTKINSNGDFKVRRCVYVYLCVFMCIYVCLWVFMCSCVHEYVFIFFEFHINSFGHSSSNICFID